MRTWALEREEVISDQRVRLHYVLDDWHRVTCVARTRELTPERIQQIGDRLAAAHRSRPRFRRGERP